MGGGGGGGGGGAKGVQFVMANSGVAFLDESQL